MTEGRGKDSQPARARNGRRELLLKAQRIEPIAVDATHDHGPGDAGEGTDDATAVAADVVRVHRLRQGQVAPRIEPAAQLVRLVIEVALDRVAPARSRVFAALRVVREPGIEFGLAAVGQVRDAPRQAHAGVGSSPGVVVVAALPVGIAGDGPDLGGLDADLVGGRPCARRQHQRRADPLWSGDHPFQRPHPAHRPAQHGGEPLEAETIGGRCLDGDLVADRDVGETGSVRSPVGGRRRRTGGAPAATEDVHREHAPPVGVERGSGSDQRAPPTRGGMIGPGRAGHVRVAGEGVEHEHDVVVAGADRTPALHADGHGRQHAAAFEVDAAHVDLGDAAQARHAVGRQRDRRLPTGVRTVGHCAAAANPRSRSARMSEIPSIPTASRTRPGVTDDASCSSGVSWACVVDAGWITSERTSPMLAT